MFGKILLSIYFMSVTQAVFIDQDIHNKQVNRENAHGWQIVNIYQTPKGFGYRSEPYAYPKYEFEYAVSDKRTGDHKHHHEARDGDRVRGEYSLVESDGSLRKVQYNVDDHTGFNAVVSKTVNKHGDHAVSVTDHTRFFYPVGHGIKINHYFPSKNYQYQNLEKPENNNDSRPVYEENEPVLVQSKEPVLVQSKEPVLVKSEEPKMIVIDSKDKVVMAEPGQAELVSTPKSDIEESPVQVVPAVVSMITESSDNDKSKNDIIQPVEKNEDLSSKETPATPEDKVVEKEDQQLDSDVASSFYHSKFYYISY